ncbi:MAG: hypothetical protein HC809_11725 [Gammaproteobacteria bacterium]|nr:hypothetical protein [Gammaproteobacteria bacterium]
MIGNEQILCLRIEMFGSHHREAIAGFVHGPLESARQHALELRNRIDRFQHAAELVLHTQPYQRSTPTI